MRSLFAKILLLFLGTNLVSLAAYVATSSFFVRRFGHETHLPHTAVLILDQSCRAYEEGGAESLAQCLDRLNLLLHDTHYLTDSAGRDLVSGEDRSALLSKARSRPPVNHPFWPGDLSWTRRRGDRLVFAHESNDGRYRLISLLPQHRVRRRVWDYWPFYFWVVLVITFLSYILAIRLVRPLRRLRRTVERFGRGDLSARSHSTRKDEIGDLSRAFDRMAQRIETLLHAERRLLQDVSHELRSPLARLHFAVELARTSPDRDSALSRIRKEADRLASLVDELLQLTRAEGDPSSRELHPVALHDLLRGLVDDCVLEAEAHRCRIELRVIRPAFLGGEGELRAFENVLRNAIRHAPEGTAIEVSLDRQGGVATIRVRDHGPGVPEEFLEEIFKPFFRVESDRDRASGGVGLGLSIARRSVGLHQGTVTARNAGPGLLVTFEFPNALDHPEEP